MSVLRRGDEELHYSDNSHRWIAPPNVEQSLWDAGMRAHLALHLSTMGGAPEFERRRDGCRPPRVPGQRQPDTRRTSDTRRAPTARLARLGAISR